MKIINNHYNINIDISNDNLQIFDINECGRKKKILSFNIDNLNNELFRIEMSKNIFGIEQDIPLYLSNTAGSKWYSGKFLEFKNFLKNL